MEDKHQLYDVSGDWRLLKVQLYPVSHFYWRHHICGAMFSSGRQEERLLFSIKLTLAEALGWYIPRNRRQPITAFALVDPVFPVIQKLDSCMKAYTEHTCSSRDEADNRQIDADTYSAHSLQSLLANEPISSDNKAEIYHNAKLATRTNCRHNEKPHLEGI